MEAARCTALCHELGNISTENMFMFTINKKNGEYQNPVEEGSSTYKEEMNKLIYPKNHVCKASYFICPPFFIWLMNNEPSDSLKCGKILLTEQPQSS
jgi:hypothetical protein